MTSEKLMSYIQLNFTNIFEECALDKFQYTWTVARFFTITPHRLSAEMLQWTTQANVNLGSFILYIVYITLMVLEWALLGFLCVKTVFFFCKNLKIFLEVLILTEVGLGL